MIYFAYDGSVNGDWVAQYAVGMAARSETGRLTLVHILDGSLPSDQLSRGINGIEKQCARRKVELVPLILPLKRDVPRSLLAALPSGPEALCVCGTRTRSRLRGYLSGTVTERLIRSAKFRVLALRVVQPGLLGHPRRLLFPLSGNAARPRDALPFLSLFQEELEEVHLMQVLSPGLLRPLSAARARELHRRGRDFLGRVASEITGDYPDRQFHLDSRVILSADWPGEIVIQANKLKTGLILLGSSRRIVPSRYYYGSRQERLLRTAPCDVAVYHSGT